MEKNSRMQNSKDSVKNKKFDISTQCPGHLNRMGLLKGKT